MVNFSPFKYMRSHRGFALLEILIVAAIMLALAYAFLKERKQQPAQFAKAMKDAGVTVPPNVKNAEDLQRVVEAQLKAATEQHQKQMNKTVDGGGN